MEPRTEAGDPKRRRLEGTTAKKPNQSMTLLKTEPKVHKETTRRTIEQNHPDDSEMASSTKKTEEEKISEFIRAAVKAKEHAYAPYSKFRVGAAVLCADGTIFSGCNVENCAYGGCICAERTALVKAVSEGHRKFKAIAITSDLKTAISPCGSCRQFMIEFGSDWDVYMTRADLTYQKFKVSELLPMGFTPSDLNNTKE